MDFELLSRPVDMGRMQQFGLLWLRVAAVFVMTPVFYALLLPPTIRALLLAALALVIALGLYPAGQPWGPVVGAGAWIAMAVSELALGASLGLGILLAFGVFSVAGNLLDVQAGFGMGQLVDPVSHRPQPILTTLFQQFALLFFFVLNGHHALLRGIAHGLERFPVGAQWLGQAWAEPLLKQAGGLFALGFALVAPVVFCLFMVEFALGVVARNLPQMNLFALGIALKVVVCLAALSLWFSGVGAAMERVYQEITKTWDVMFAAPAPGALQPRSGG